MLSANEARVDGRQCQCSVKTRTTGPRTGTLEVLYDSDGEESYVFKTLTRQLYWYSCAFPFSSSGLCASWLGRKLGGGIRTYRHCLDRRQPGGASRHDESALGRQNLGHYIGSAGPDRCGRAQGRRHSGRDRKSVV